MSHRKSDPKSTKDPKKIKSKKQERVHINQEFVLSYPYDAPWGKSKIDLFVYIPYGENYIAIMVQEDELLSPTIKQITWLTNTFQFTPYKTDLSVENSLNDLAADSDPAHAYDRVREQKHFVRKIYYFDKAQIFVDPYSRSAHIINLLISKGKQELTLDLRADIKLYEEPVFLKPDPVHPASLSPSPSTPINKTPSLPAQDPEEEVPYGNIPQIEPNYLDSDSEDSEF